eukprot:CAMPEP_0201513438 /NCGR_PEP_ID=MMETSP0161_2-20130828/5483_1 /ASSEMBLY_ACC=CAM_ASM_000251 /TAXON_ID=180227 /ORGANISM="Neoparamoeba aestuarina, Strain SoJaBio B1-5/56/2" /LENGTH=500 /DNA_ID=CAMNT_0047909641 /DNA_START=194 /DNA_END=1696 /DNA_ORIENTATION=+
MLQPEEEGVGRWFIGHNLGDTAGVAFVDSWAVVPHAISEMSPLSVWHVYMRHHGGWREDPKVEVECVDEFDDVLYLCSNLNKGSCGFYFPYSEYLGSQVLHSTNGRKFYRLPSGRWMISEDEVGSEAGIAFLECKNKNDDENIKIKPRDVNRVCTKYHWRVSTGEGWLEDKNFLFYGGGLTGSRKGPSVFSRARTSARIKTDPYKGTSLSNGVYLPLIGLGTGGLSREETKAVVTAAISDHKYQLIDTASAYNNEDVIGEAFRDIDPSGSLRSEVMVLSKVWPTQLGFKPTLGAIDEGLGKFQTGYFDVYLLHWPECDSNIEWMECPPTPTGTWQQSWRALEKAYAEGLVRAIGVSNFDARLLGQLFDHVAAVPPHLVQNWMDPLHVDNAVLEKCALHKTMFQAYSLVREWVGRKTGDRRRKQIIRKLAIENQLTISELILRWALQLGPQVTGTTIGAVVRSRTRAHLGSNMDVVKREPLSFKTMQTMTNLQFLDFRSEL